jgi:hypothetical protein
VGAITVAADTTRAGLILLANAVDVRPGAHENVVETQALAISVRHDQREPRRAAAAVRIPLLDNASPLERELAARLLVLTEADLDQQDWLAGRELPGA